MSKKKIGVNVLAVFVVLMVAALMWFPPSQVVQSIRQEVATSQEDSAYRAFKAEKAAILVEEKGIYEELMRWRIVGKSRGYFQRDYTGYDDMVRDDPEFAAYDVRRKDMERRKKELMERYPDEIGW